MLVFVTERQLWCVCFLPSLTLFLFVRQAEEQLRIVEEQRKIHEERMKLEQDRQRQQKEEQKIILGKGKSRPKLSFSLKATEWTSSFVSIFIAIVRPSSVERFVLEVPNTNCSSWVYERSQHLPSPDTQMTLVRAFFLFFNFSGTWTVVVDALTCPSTSLNFGLLTSANLSKTRCYLTMYPSDSPQELASSLGVVTTNQNGRRND